MDSKQVGSTAAGAQPTQVKEEKRQNADIEGSRHSSSERHRKQRYTHGGYLIGQRSPDGARVHASGSDNVAEPLPLPNTRRHTQGGFTGPIVRTVGNLNAARTGGICSKGADVASPSYTASPAERGQSLARTSRDNAIADCCPSSPLSPMPDGAHSRALSSPLLLSLSSDQRDLERPDFGQPSRVRSNPYYSQGSIKSPAGPQKLISRLRIMLGLLGVTVFVVVMALTIILFAWRSPAPLRRVCNTHACQAYSDRLLASINESVNPCQSFTHFVCDGWHQKNQHGVWEDEFISVLAKLITALKKVHVSSSERQTPEQQSAITYRSCVDVLEGERDELPAVKDALVRAGIVWPRPSKGADVLYTLLYSSLKLGWGVLLDFHAATGGEISIVPGQFLKFVNWWHPNFRDASSKAYFEFLKESFRRKGEDTVTYQDIQVSLEVDPSYFLDEDDLRASEHSAGNLLRMPELGLTEANWIEKLIKLGISMNSSVSLTTTTPDYLEDVLRLWQQNGSDRFHTLVSWWTVQVAALFANKNLIFNFYDRDYATTQAYHKVFCLTEAMVFSGLSLFNKYNANLQKGDALDFAKHMTHSIRTTFFRRLSSWTFFDENINVVNNWSSVEAVFRYFDRREEDESPTVNPIPDLNSSFVWNWQQSVHVKKAPELEHILNYMIELEYNIVSYNKLDLQLMPYTLSFPLFDPRLPPSLNYGGLGSVVARAHGDLFIYAYIESNSSHVKSFINCINWNTSDDDETLEYISALVASYGALVDAYYVEGGASDTGIFGLEKYTGLQLLFIAMCYSECQGRSVEDVGESSCSRGLQYIPQFSQAFHCVPGDPMHPSRKCQLF